MDLSALLNSRPAQEERAILGVTKGQQKSSFGDLIDKAVPKAQKQADDANKYALDTMSYVKGNEGYRSEIYDDTKGLKTIGYGFNLKDKTTAKLLPADVLSGKRKITQDEAEEVFTKRFAIAIDDAISFVGKEYFDKLSNSQKKGLIDMSYNMGAKSLNGFDELRKALQSGDKLKAKYEVLHSQYRKDVPARALRNSNLMLK